jgi:hypothetical protein
MSNGFQNGLTCTEFEALLADALDGVLAADVRQDFESHGESCQVCGPLWAEARQGMVMVRGLEDIEPPQNLVHNILARTSMKQVGAEPAGHAAKSGWVERMRRGLRPSLGGAMRSRFAMSFAMAFFSLSITLTLVGVKASDIGNMVAHPSLLRKNVVIGFTQIQAKVTSYYENLRLVYEVQARVREMKKSPPPASGTGNENKQQNRKSAPDDSGRPQQKENYSRELDGRIVAITATRHEGAQI